jgi:hypothetical protein
MRSGEDSQELSTAVNVTIGLLALQLRAQLFDQ